MSNRAAAIQTEPNIGDIVLNPRREPATAPSTSRIRHAEAGDLPGANLPGQLQREVAEALAQGAFDLTPEEGAVEGKWSARRTLAFMFGTCSVFWGLVAWAVIKLF